MVDNKVTLQSALNNYAKLMKQYKITSTPRVTVAGVYETNPEYVDGDPKKFEIVINALISMASEGWFANIKILAKRLKN